MKKCDKCRRGFRPNGEFGEGTPGPCPYCNGLGVQTSKSLFALLHNSKWQGREKPPSHTRPEQVVATYQTREELYIDYWTHFRDRLMVAAEYILIGLQLEFVEGHAELTTERPKYHGLPPKSIADRRAIELGEEVMIFPSQSPGNVHSQEIDCASGQVLSYQVNVAFVGRLIVNADEIIPVRNP